MITATPHKAKRQGIPVRRDRAIAAFPAVLVARWLPRIREPNVIAATALIAVLGWVAITTPGAWASLAVLVFGAALLARPAVVPRDAIIIISTAAVTVSVVDYLSWRWSVLNWSNWWIAVPLFAAEAFGATHTLGFQYTVWPRRERPLLSIANTARLPIFIFIPTVNEGVSILEPTIRGALAARARYLAVNPETSVSIIVCNDGRVAGAANWQETELLAWRLGVVCVTRRVGGGAKAGNIEHARRHVGAIGDALVVIFDADQIAEPDFLLKTVEPFADPRVGWVQTGQYYRNRENPVARWADDQQALFYRILCPGKATQNAAFICGTNVVLRAAILDEIGGLPQDSVTEDFAASILLHPRWRSVFLPDVLARGIGPMDLGSYFRQQGRWATGTMGVLRTHWRAIFLPGAYGLRFNQRVQYALACTHYLCGLRDLIYVVTPLVFVLTGVPAVRGAYLSVFLWHFVPYWVASQGAFWYVSSRRASLRGIVVGFGSFPVLLRSLLTVLLGRRIGFAVTSKRRSTERLQAHLFPHALAFICCSAALGNGLWRRHESGPLLISVLWIAYTLGMLSCLLWLGLADLLQENRWLASARRRMAWSHRARPVVVRSALAAVVVCVGIGHVASAMPATGQAAAFKPRWQAGHMPAPGIWLPSALTQVSPSRLQRQFSVSPAVVGRTQLIADSFDPAWANVVRTQGGQPWITLLFGVPGVPSLDATLPAIVNGIQDAALHRWADEIRAYGRPVYLTILPQVDRPWQPSSAVASSGKAEDAPRAWRHIQVIFRHEGARNVAWVWGPADPVHDAQFAPPRTSLNVVLLRLTALSATARPDPSAEIRAVSQHYPRTPLFVQVTAAGSRVQRAVWLRQVAAAARAQGDVAALIYYVDEASSSRRQQLSGTLAADGLALRALGAIR